jgi:protein gp37
MSTTPSVGCAAGLIEWTRLGKARAGRLLDGREWNEMPGAKGETA